MLSGNATPAEEKAANAALRRIQKNTREFNRRTREIERQVQSGEITGMAALQELFGLWRD